MSQTNGAAAANVVREAAGLLPLATKSTSPPARSLANGRRPAVRRTPPVHAGQSSSRGRGAGCRTLGQGNGREAQRLAAVILEVLAGARTPTQAAAALNVSIPRYYQLETRALRGLIEACETRPRGRQKSAERELAVLKRQQERLERELGRQQSLVRLTQRNLGLLPPTPAPKPAAGKKRRRRPVVRALAAAAQLQQRSLEDPGPATVPDPPGT